MPCPAQWAAQWAALPSASAPIAPIGLPKGRRGEGTASTPIGAHGRRGAAKYIIYGLHIKQNHKYKIIKEYVLI